MVYYENKLKYEIYYRYKVFLAMIFNVKITWAYPFQ